MAELICTWMERGIQATTIHAALVERYGFTGGYDSVKRFIRRNKKAAPATVFHAHTPAETAQVDFGAGPVIIDVQTGEVMKTWFFAMTLTCSKHMYVELVTNQRVETWLGCHRRAFEHFGGAIRVPIHTWASISLALAVSTREKSMALASAPLGTPAKSQFFLPRSTVFGVLSLLLIPRNQSLFKFSKSPSLKCSICA